MSPNTNRPISPVASLMSTGAYEDVILDILDFLRQPDVLSVSHTCRALRKVALRHPHRYAAVFFPVDTTLAKSLYHEVGDFCSYLDGVDAHDARMSITVPRDTLTEDDIFAGTKLLRRLKASMSRVVGLDLVLPAHLVPVFVEAVQPAPLLRSMRLLVPSSPPDRFSPPRQPILDFTTIFGAKCDAPQLRQLSIACEDRACHIPTGNKLASLPRLKTLLLRGNTERGTWPHGWRKAIAHATASVQSITIVFNDAAEDDIRVDLRPLLQGLRGPWHVAMPDTCRVDNYLEVATTDGAFRRRLMWGDQLSSELVGAITKQLAKRDFAKNVISLDVEPGYVLDMVEQEAVFPNLHHVTFHSMEPCAPPRTPDALDKQFLLDVDGCTREHMINVALDLFQPGSPSVVDFWCPRCGDDDNLLDCD